MLRFIIFTFCFLVYMPLHAETSANIKISATIEKGCAFYDSGAVLDFGSHPTSSKETNVTASVVNNRSTWSLECTPGIPVSITFDNGKNFDTATQTRRLKSEVGNYFVNYQVYSNAAHSKVIGVNSPSNTLSLISNTFDNILDFGVYGLIDLSKGEANKPSGKYSDEVLITIIW